MGGAVSVTGATHGRSQTSKREPPSGPIGDSTHLTAHGRREFSHDGDPEARAHQPVPSPISLIRAFEDAFEITRRNAWSVVVHGDKATP
jgi:hypothetical protein